MNISIHVLLNRENLLDRSLGVKTQLSEVWYSVTSEKFVSACLIKNKKATYTFEGGRNGVCGFTDVCVSLGGS